MQSNWNGHLFEYKGGSTGCAIRLCKDVETRSQSVTFSALLPLSLTTKSPL
ncbi:hypothetical protein Hanom_Chr14g01283811 [Helianthus anomalus]